VLQPAAAEPALGWIGRDHRKCLVVDDRVAFVTGLCVGTMWEGDAERGLPGWRDTGVEVRGPAVAEVGMPLQTPGRHWGAPASRREFRAWASSGG